MTWEGTRTGDGYDTSAYPGRPARSSAATRAGIAYPVVVVAVLVVGVTVWILHLQSIAPQAPLVTSVAPQPVPAGTGTGTGAGAAGSTSADRSAEGAASPLDRVDHSWAARAAAATGIPDRAFLAYASADLTIEEQQPACGLGWNTLAAVGTVESANGTYGGTRLLASGYTSKPIIGVPLDGGTFGGGKIAAIPATDQGRRGGDARWEHAVGPMQFLPSTWARWGANGSGDRVASPDQIDDAALAAARYLCASGPMSTAAGWRAAVFSYNQSNAYVNEVAGIANGYAADVRGLS